jgi:hypothetical protein
MTGAADLRAGLADEEVEVHTPVGLLDGVAV